MQNLLHCRKLIGLTLVITIFGLNFGQNTARAAMVTTECIIDKASEPLSDRGRIKAFLARADAMAHLQAYGISPEEALSRVDSLTDSEITTLAGRMDQATAVAGGYEMGGGALWIVGLLMYTIVFLIVFYFSRAKMKEDLEKSSTVETEEKTETTPVEEKEKTE